MKERTTEGLEKEKRRKKKEERKSKENRKTGKK